MLLIIKYLWRISGLWQPDVTPKTRGGLKPAQIFKLKTQCPAPFFHSDCDLFYSDFREAQNRNKTVTTCCSLLTIICCNENENRGQKHRHKLCQLCSFVVPESLWSERKMTSKTGNEFRTRKSVFNPVCLHKDRSGYRPCNWHPTVTGQNADKQTCGQSSRGLSNSRTGQLA